MPLLTCLLSTAFVGTVLWDIAASRLTSKPAVAAGLEIHHCLMMRSPAPVPAKRDRWCGERLVRLVKRTCDRPESTAGCDDGGNGNDGSPTPGTGNLVHDCCENECTRQHILRVCCAIRRYSRRAVPLLATAKRRRP